MSGRMEHGISQSLVNRSRRDPTADAAIGHITREEKRRRREAILREKQMVKKGVPCCGNCAHYCFWDVRQAENGCKNYHRPNYQQNPESKLCPQWKRAEWTEERQQYAGRTP